MRRDARADMRGINGMAIGDLESGFGRSAAAPAMRNRGHEGRHRDEDRNGQGDRRRRQNRKRSRRCEMTGERDVLAERTGRRIVERIGFAGGKRLFEAEAVYGCRDLAPLRHAQKMNVCLGDEIRNREDGECQRRNGPAPVICQVECLPLQTQTGSPTNAGRTLASRRRQVTFQSCEPRR